MEYGKHNVAQVGQLSGSPYNTVESFRASGVINFGRPLMRHAPFATTCAIYNNFGAGTLNKFLGVSVYSTLTVPNPSLSSPGGLYLDDEMVSVLTNGRIWTTLKSGLTITAGETCYIDESTLVFNDDFTNIPTGTHINIGTFLNSGTSDGLTGEAMFLIEIQTGFNVPL